MLKQPSLGLLEGQKLSDKEKQESFKLPKASRFTEYLLEKFNARDLKTFLLRKRDDDEVYAVYLKKAKLGNYTLSSSGAKKYEGIIPGYNDNKEVILAWDDYGDEYGVSGRLKSIDGFKRRDNHRGIKFP